MFVGDGEEVLGRVHPFVVGALGVTQPARQHTRRHARAVHRGDKVLNARAIRDVLTEEFAGARVLILRGPLGGELLRDEVDPRVEDDATHRIRECDTMKACASS